MPKAPGFYNFFVPADSHARTHTRSLTRTLLLKHRTQEAGLLFKRSNDCVLGRKVIGLHLGAWEEVRCTVYLLCLSILIWEGGKCHFTLYALINRAFPPSAISQLCLQAHPIPARPMLLWLHTLPINKRFSFPESLLKRCRVCFFSVSRLRHPFWKGLPVGRPGKCDSEVWSRE